MKFSINAVNPNRLIKKIRRGWHFMIDDVWDVEISSLSKWSGMGVKSLRVIYLVFRGYKQDECSMHASALTFSSLMAIVPVLALSLALARGFGDAETAKAWINGRVTSWTETFSSQDVADNKEGNTDNLTAETKDSQQWQLATEIDRLVQSGFDKVDKISFKALGGVGLAFLLLMVIEVLGHVERSFNGVWGVAKGRAFWRRFTDYLSVLLVLPVLVVASASLPIMDFISRFLDESSMQFIRNLANSGAFRNLTVLLMTSLSFSFLIMFMPNTRVRMRAGLSGGFVAALLFLVWLWLCAAIQFGAARYGKIYGGFAVVPILLAWVYVSWCIVLFGAEVAFAVQNCNTYIMEQSAHKANIQARMTLALAVVVEAARAMMGKRPHFTASDYARSNGVPVRFLNDIVEELVNAGYLGQLSTKSGAFALLKSPVALPVKEVVGVVMSSGVKPVDLGLTGLDPRIEEAVESAGKGINDSLRDTTIQDLLD